MITSLCHTMLSKLWFCCVIKYCSTWHVNVVSCLGVESMSRSLEHGLFPVGRKLTWPISLQVKENDWYQEDHTKMEDSLIPLSSYFSCLYCTHPIEVQNQWEETSHPRFWNSSLSSPGHHFIYPDEVKSKSQLLNWSDLNIWPSATGDGEHHVACRCGTPAANPIADRHNQGLQSLLWQLLMSVLPLSFTRQPG